jgi:hypothetical protein
VADFEGQKEGSATLVEAVVTRVEVLNAPRIVALCVWCKKDAEDDSQWITLNGRPIVPLCQRCHKDVEKVAQAMVIFGRFVLPKMVKK